MGYRVLVDLDACEANAMCMMAAPTVFDVGDDGALRVLDEAPPDELRAKVAEAARLCPRQAITVVDR